MSIKTIEIKLTPELVAEAFWEFDNEEQADFFCELAKQVKDSNHHSQWLALVTEIRKRDQETQNMYMDFCAFAYDYFEQKVIL